MIDYEKYEGMIPKPSNSDSLEEILNCVIAITESTVNGFIRPINNALDDVPNFIIEDLNMRLGMEGINNPLNTLKIHESLWHSVFPEEPLKAAAERARLAINDAENLDKPKSHDILDLMSNLSPLLSLIDREVLSSLLLCTYFHTQQNVNIFSIRFSIIIKSLILTEGEKVDALNLGIVTREIPNAIPFSQHRELSKYFNSENHIHGSAIASGLILENDYVVEDANDSIHRIVRITDNNCVLSIARGMWECIGESNKMKIEERKMKEPRVSTPRQIAPSEQPGFVPPSNEFEELWAQAMLED